MYIMWHAKCWVKIVMYNEKCAVFLKCYEVLTNAKLWSRQNIQFVQVIDILFLNFSFWRLLVWQFDVCGTLAAVSASRLQSTAQQHRQQQQKCICIVYFLWVYFYCRFVTQIQDQTSLVEMQSSKFECQLAPVGDPHMKVEWFFNGKPLPHSE